METCDKLYMFDRPMGGVEELLVWNQGMGLHHPNFMDVFVLHGAPDPVNFNVDDLGLGQVNAPNIAQVEMKEPMDGVVQDSFVRSMGPKRLLLAHEPPLGDMD
ncbi:hypothetical protein ACET3Z_004765 [Daucus carota]